MVVQRVVYSIPISTIHQSLSSQSDRANRFETECLNYKLIKTGGFVVYSLAENRNLTDPVKFRLSPRHSSLTTKNNFIKRIVELRIREGLYLNLYPMRSSTRPVRPHLAVV